MERLRTPRSSAPQASQSSPSTWLGCEPLTKPSQVVPDETHRQDQLTTDPRDRTVGYMTDSDIDPTPAHGSANMRDGGGQRDRQEWVRANFTQIFGTSADELQAQGINPRQYAREHRGEIRQFAQIQRSQGIAVPTGRPTGARRPDSGEPKAGGRANGEYGYGRSRSFGVGMRGGTGWIGVLLVLFALRFLLVDSFAGTHAAIFWVLGIGGIMLVARVFLFSWLRKRRFNRRHSGQRN